VNESQRQVLLRERSAWVGKINYARQEIAEAEDAIEQIDEELHESRA
jgi:hypothetical protein